MLRGLITIASVGVSCLVALPLAAQERDPAAAQALFDQARALMKAKNYAEACPKLAESQRLDPGIGTQFHLADCYENQGKVASAWAAFLDVASLASASNQPDREKAAKARAARLEPRLPRLTIVVPATSRVPGLTVTRDGVTVGEIQWGSALPVDPGKREVSVSAPGRQTYTDTVTVSEGTAASVKVPALQPAPEGAAAAPSATTVPPATAPPENGTSAPQPVVPAGDQGPASTEESSGPGPLVIGLGVVGVVGLGAGTVLGLMAKSKYDDSKAHCLASDENRCNAQGIELRDDALSLGTMSTVGFIVGGVALAGAGVLWIAGGDSKQAAHGGSRSFRAGLAMSPTRGSVVLRGSF